MGSGLFGTSTLPTMGAPQGTTSRSDRRLQVRGGQGRHLGVVAAYAPGGQGRHFGVVVAYMPGDGQTDIWEWLLPIGRGRKATFTIHQETRTEKKESGGSCICLLFSTFTPCRGLSLVLFAFIIACI